MDVDVMEHVPYILPQAVSLIVLPILLLFVAVAIIWEFRR